MIHTLIDTLEPRTLFAATLTPAVTYETSLKTSGAQKNWAIPLVAGQNITLSAGDTSGTALQTELILIGPTGKVFRRSVGQTGSFISLNVPITGEWRVRLRDVGRDDTGSVKVTAFFYAPTITDSDDAFVAESGRRRAATIEPGDLDVWTITASQGQFLSALATENTAGDPLDIGVLIIGPNGTVVDGGEDERGVKVDIASSSAGNYYAVVYEAGADNAGRYGISFARAPGEQYAGDPDTIDPLQSGVPRTGDLPGGDTDVFVAAVTAGQTITTALTGTTGSLDPEILLINPSGQVVATTHGVGTTTLTYNVPTGGNYWIVTRDREADDGGQYSLTYTLS